MDPEGQLRNLRDFLLVYNRMTDICFQRCTNNFNYRDLTMEEVHCADSCAGKLIRSNHRIMGTYVKLMPAMVQRRMEEMESKAAEVAKAAESVGPAEPLAGGLERSDTPTTVITSLSTASPKSAPEQSGTVTSHGTVHSAPSWSSHDALVSSGAVSDVPKSRNTSSAQPPTVDLS